MKGKTVLIIAHRYVKKINDDLFFWNYNYPFNCRLSTVKNADQIAVISNGKLIEIGSYSELIDLKGIFYQLIKQQQSS